MEQRLSLTWTAGDIAAGAIGFQLGDVAADGQPAGDLPLIVRASASAVVATIPLEPSARVVGVDPSALPPVGERERRIDTEQIECGIVALGAKAGAAEPAGGELGSAIGHVASTEDAKLKHLRGSEVRSEADVKRSPGGGG